MNSLQLTNVDNHRSDAGVFVESANGKRDHVVRPS